MLGFWNSQSVWSGADMRRMNEIRDLLDAAKIRHRVKTKSHMSQWSGRGTTRGNLGSIGNPVEQMYSYEIFVHRQDAEQARHLIG